MNRSSTADYAIHVEAGLLPRIGIHVRNDAVRSKHSSEAALMLNLFVTEDRNFGISAVGEMHVPTGPGDNSYKGSGGAAVEYILPPFAAINANIDYDPSDKVAEYETALVLRTSSILYPVVEVHGEFGKDMDSMMSILTGLKFKFEHKGVIGLAYRFAVTDAREFSNMGVLQYEFELD